MGDVFRRLCINTRVYIQKYELPVITIFIIYVGLMQDDAGVEFCEVCSASHEVQSSNLDCDRNVSVSAKALTKNSPAVKSCG